MDAFLAILTNKIKIAKHKSKPKICKKAATYCSNRPT